MVGRTPETDRPRARRSRIGDHSPGAAHGTFRYRSSAQPRDCHAQDSGNIAGGDRSAAHGRGQLCAPPRRPQRCTRLSDRPSSTAFPGRAARPAGKKFRSLERTRGPGDCATTLSRVVGTLALRRSHDCPQSSSCSGRATCSACRQSPRQLRLHSRRPSWSLRRSRFRRQRHRGRKWIGQESRRRFALWTLRRQDVELHLAGCRRSRA